MSNRPGRILVTGGSGFIGARVVRRLVDEGREVGVLLRSGRPARRIGDLRARWTELSADLCDITASRTAIESFQPDAVLHLGWQGVQGAARNSDVQFDNIDASLSLYRLASEIGCSRFVGLGSQAEYGPCEGRLREDAPVRPTTVYGAAKLAVCMVLERHAHAAGRHFAWLRLFSCYGPDDDPAWLVPYLTRKLLAGEKPSLTRAEQVWDYLYVDDAAAAVIAAMDAPANGIFNLGSGEPRPLRDIITLVRDAVDPALALGFGEQPYRPDQVMHLEADIGALTAATGWRPAVTLEQGIARTVAWYREESRHAD